MNGRLRTARLSRYLLPPVLLAVFVAFVPDVAEAGPGEWIAKILYEMVVTVFGTIAGWMGLLLDYAIYMYTIGFGTIYLHSGLGFAIDDIWSIVRDVFNLTFIFGLVYIGIKLILDSEDSSAKRALVMLIGAALLVNFSLFFTKVIVDASHLLTEAIAEGFDADTYTTVPVGAGSIEIKNISAEFVDLMDLGSVYNTNGNQTISVTSGGQWALIFLTMLLLLIASFVFAAGAVLLIIRFIALNYYLILSPVMFLGWVFPNLQSFSSKWWSGFLRSTFLAPAYLFLIYIAARTLGSFKDFVTDQQVAGGLSGAITSSSEVGLFSIVPYFVVIAGFLIGSVILAQKLGVAGSSTVVKVGHNLRQRGQRALGASTAGMAARAGRNTVGYAAEKASQSQRLNRLAGKSWVGKQALKGTRKVADSSFEARQLLGKDLQKEMGSGRKGGYTTVLKEQEKEEKKFADSLKKANMAKDDVGEFVDKEVDKEVKEKTQKIVSEQSEIKNEAEAQKAALQNEIASDRARIVELNQKMETASPSDKLKYENEMKELNTSLEQKEAELPEKLAPLTTAIEHAEKRMGNARNVAEAQVEFANQLAYIEQLQRGANFWKSGRTRGAAGAAAGGGALAVSGGALLASPALIMGGGAGVAAQSKAYENERMVAALRREYGPDGTSAKKSSQQKKQMKVLSDAMKESGALPEGGGEGTGGGGGEGSGGGESKE